MCSHHFKLGTFFWNVLPYSLQISPPFNFGHQGPENLRLIFFARGVDGGLKFISVEIWKSFWPTAENPTCCRKFSSPINISAEIHTCQINLKLMLKSIFIFKYFCFGLKFKPSKIYVDQKLRPLRPHDRVLGMKQHMRTLELFETWYYYTHKVIQTC